MPTSTRPSRRGSLLSPLHRTACSSIGATLAPALLLGAALAAALAPPAAAAQQTSREAMWPAPTKEDWAKPCLIPFQRGFQDAIEVSQRTGKPILICVNMDGEIASEHYAGIRYRQPDKAALYTPYVCVIASVYRHNPRDYDEDGNRIPCPRFGSVTCGEHIAIEPVLHDQYFEDTRVAPRHIMVELDRKEVFDVYYAFDTQSVFETIRKGITDRDFQPEEQPDESLSIEDRIASPDAADRVRVERAFQAGDLLRKRTILTTAIATKEVSQTDLLRLALFSGEPELSGLAWRALLESDSPEAVGLIADLLNEPLAPLQRDELVATLERLSAVSPKAKMLAVVHQGLASRSETLDADAWRHELEEHGDAEAARDDYTAGARLEQQARLAESRPQDPDSQLEFALSLLRLATHPQTDARYAKLLLEDANHAAEEAERAGARPDDWRLHATRAILFHRLGDVPAAHERAERAMRTMPSGADDWMSMETLALYAVANQRRIAKAVREGQDWQPEWLTEAHTAYELLARHPLGTEFQVADHYDLLRALKARALAGEALDQGLKRFPDSWALHARLRDRVLAERGLTGFDGLEAVYDSMLRADDAAPNLEWFAGYASLVVAEFHRRGTTEERAHGAYERAIAHYERSVEANEQNRESADHYIAIALAGQARLALERGELEGATDLILASIDRAPRAAATLDGLGLSAVATAQMLRSICREAGRDDLDQRIDVALSSLDPKLLELPAFERGGPTRAQRRGQGARRSGGAPPQVDR